MRTITILNPTAGGGRAMKVWKKLQPRIEVHGATGPLKVTSAPGDATKLAREALEAGIQRILVVGGDGTFNEVINGCFDKAGPIDPDAVLVPLAAGTGSDFSNLLLSRRMPPDEIMTIDLGKVACTGTDGGEVIRYFANVASCGQSALMALSKRRAVPPVWFGGKAAYFLAILKTLWSYQTPVVTVTAGGRQAPPLRVRCVAIANGRTFGGGLVIAPNSHPADGELDITVIGDASPLWLLRHARDIYRGNHDRLEHLSNMRIRHAAIAAGNEVVAVEADGEAIGRLPATFEVIPRALRVALPSGV